MPLATDYETCVDEFRAFIHAEESFDIIERHFQTAGGSFTLFFIDGLTKENELQKLITFFLSEKQEEKAVPCIRDLPAACWSWKSTYEELALCVLSGETAIFSSALRGCAYSVNFRTYPGRSIGEPESDKVMQGARDGFVESLLVNTALIRRRIKDRRLRIRHLSLSGASNTDVALCYMAGVADDAYVEKIEKKIRAIRPKGVCLGFQSLTESLLRRGWWNPFPKVRLTERPDTASAQILEGFVVLLTDTAPNAMILPTSFFDYLQQTDDYYFPPLTGTYLRLVRTVILFLSVVLTPLWFCAVKHASLLPPFLSFLVPTSPGALPLLLQLYLAEFVIDGLKIASMNTPDMLSNSLSVVGALILGDFAIEVGWFSEDVVLYMAFVAIATFAQQNRELGYAFKFVRLITLGLTALFDLYGILLGLFLFFLLLLCNETADGTRRYLYPLLPFNGKALCKLLFRVKKDDFDEE